MANIPSRTTSLKNGLTNEDNNQWVQSKIECEGDPIMENPYNQGQPVWEDKFYGRGQLIEDILNGKSGRVSIIGARGMGKTSLLRKIEHRLDSTTNIGIYCSLEGVEEGNFKDRFGHVSTMKSDSFKKGGIRNIEKVFRKAKDTFDVLSTLDKELRKREVRLFLLFDSAENLANLDSEFVKGLRGFFEMVVNIRCILAISSLGIRRLEEKSVDWNTSPFLYGSERHLIKSLDDEEAEDLIRQKNKVNVSDDTVAEIQGKTGNQPYLIQLLCHELFDENKGCLTEVSPENLYAVSTVASSIMEDSYNLLLPPQQEIIRHVSKVESITIEALRKQVDLPESSLRRNVYELMDFGYLKKSEEQYSISNYFLKEWLVENRDSLIQPVTQPVPAENEELLEKIRDIHDSIHPPVLDNYQGFVTAQWTNLIGEKLPPSERAEAVASVRETVQLIVTFQKDEPEPSQCEYKLIDIFEGNDSEQVTFVVKIVSKSLNIIDKSRIALTTRTTTSAVAKQQFRFTTEREGIHHVYVEAYQKKQPIQVVQTILEVQGQELNNAT